MKAGIRIEGVPEAVAAIKDLEDQLQKRLVRQALQKMGMEKNRGSGKAQRSLCG